MKVKFRKLSFFLISNPSKDDFYSYVKKIFKLNEASFEFNKRRIDQFIRNHNFRWKKSWNKQQFTEKHKSWLEDEFSIENVPVATKRKSFEIVSDKTKKRRVDSVYENHDFLEIKSTYLKYLQDMDSVEALIIKRICQLSEEQNKFLLQFIKHSKFSEEESYTADKALALFIDAKLSVAQYKMLRKSALAINHNLHPRYNKMLEAKQLCYPKSIKTTQRGASIKIQDLMDLTTQQIVQVCDIPDETQDLELISKYGMDGAGNQNCWKILFGGDRASFSESSVHLMTMVPLQLRSKSSGNVYWNNLHPSSTWLDRPIEFEFVKETADVTQKKFRKAVQQINFLRPTTLDKNGAKTKIYHDLTMTMVDGKTVSNLANVGFSNCNICGKRPTEMNDLTVNYDSDTGVMSFGLSTLHCWIRFLECVLHIAYKLTVKKWIVKKPHEKAMVLERKLHIQNEFRSKTGLLLDCVKQGTGTTNDGNTARRFFKDAEFASKTTGVNIDLIKRFRVILCALSTRKKVDSEKFRVYALNTAKLYLSLYKWYYMPPALHKVLIHGADIINQFDLPIGWYSEEAQEARNKDFRYIREHHTRKMNRECTNEDIFNYLLVSSDPRINVHRHHKDLKIHAYEDDCLGLLIT